METGGLSVLRSLQNIAGDAMHNGFMPQQTDRTAHRGGPGVRRTKGAVVYGDDVIELIQYAPTTP